MLVPLLEAAKLIPSHRPGKKIHVNVLRRWCRSGRLPSVRRGQFYFVDTEDLQTFYRDGKVEAPVLRRPSVRRAEDRWAERVMKEMGI
jgi:predicted site-specific integrase-resolvase